MSGFIATQQFNFYPAGGRVQDRWDIGDTLHNEKNIYNEAGIRVIFVAWFGHVNVLVVKFVNQLKNLAKESFCHPGHSELLLLSPSSENFTICNCVQNCFCQIQFSFSFVSFGIKTEASFYCFFFCFLEKININLIVLFPHRIFTWLTCISCGLLLFS